MKKIKICILVIMLLIATAVLPVVGTMSKFIDSDVFSTNLSEIEWSRTYGGEEADKFWDVEETSDGGYIASGTTEIENNHCPWVLKVDSDGNEMWDWKITGFDYGGTYVDISYSWCDDVMQTSDGEYIIGITGFLFNHNDENYGVGGLLKLDSNGEEEWMQIYGNTFELHTGVEYIKEVDDGFVCAGSHGPALGGNSPTRDTDICLFKTDSVGEIIWHQEYDYSDLPNWARGFCFTNDGGYLIAGQANVEDYDTWFPCMIKTDSNGNEEWHKIYGGIDAGTFWNVYQTSDGGYIAAGGSNDLWIVKTDISGNIMWNKSFGERTTDYGWDFDETDDGGYIASVIINVMGMNTENWVLKVDNSGNAEWKHIYGQEGGKEYFLSICPTSNGGCIASGMSGGWDGSSSDALLVKYAPMENQRPNKPDIDGPSKGKPDTEYTFTVSGSDPDGDTLQYKWDWGDGNFSEWFDTNEASYTWTTEDNFEVRVMTMDEHGGESDWSDPFEFSTPKNKKINILNKLESYIPLDVPNGWLEGADQYQTSAGGYGFIIQPSFYCAQEFKPSKETLTAVAMPFFKFGDPPSGTTITVWIRDDLDGNDLTTTSIDADSLRFKNDKGKWALFDFEDIDVIPEESYYLVCTSDKGTFDPDDENNTNTYCWFFDFDNKYARGIAYHSEDFEETWYDLENYFDDPEYVECDFTFITYFQEPPKNKGFFILEQILERLIQRFPILELLFTSDFLD